MVPNHTHSWVVEFYPVLLSKGPLVSVSMVLSCYVSHTCQYPISVPIYASPLHSSVSNSDYVSNSATLKPFKSRPP